MAIFNGAIGFEALSLNSALVSAQSRKRIYFCWQRNEDGTYSQVHIEQPEDRGLLLKDVLEDIPFDSLMWKELPEKYVSVVKEITKAHALTATYTWASPKHYFEKGQRQLVVWQFRRSDIRIHAEQNKVCTLMGNMGTGGHNVPILNQPICLNPIVDWVQPSLSDRIYSEDNNKLLQIRIPEATKKWYCEPVSGNCVDMAQANSKTRRGRLMVDKANTLTVSNEFHLLEELELKYYWRKLTVKECARLQGIPDWYEFIVSNSRAYKMIGNGWQVDTIEYIFSHFNLCGK